ncbi:hypothetical protein AXF42_Ash003970 [Apostasia shenzhenica]|uniref:Protein FLX-like 1 n=1 Tax=Apostasia shenzhenica TaxID=1088818 RepID=A0A2I0AIE4_9ASPA|nr:hypothetical protein AXF42_Ash003970 [Apostasia shenzhenica]
MAGRARVPPHVLQLGDTQPPVLGRPPLPPVPLLDEHLIPIRVIPPPGPHPAIISLEEQLAAQHREIQILLSDNQHLAATHVALKQELDAAQHELRLAASAAAKTRVERESELREVYDRSVRAETEARAMEAMRTELVGVRADVQKLKASRVELLERSHGLKAELARARTELRDLPALRAEIEAMHREIQRGRAAVEYEKKAHSENLEQRKAMERNMTSMAGEVEKLRAELANAEKRARAAAAAATAAVNPGAGYTDAYGNPEIAYGGNTYNAAYIYHQAQGADVNSQYGQTAGSYSGYEQQQAFANR